MIALIGVWGIVVGVIGLNGFAAGIVTVLHLWKRCQSRGGKVLIAAVSSALLSTGIIGPRLLFLSSAGGTTPAMIALGAIIMFVVAMAASLPGAIIVARKLEAPDDVYRTFD